MKVTKKHIIPLLSLVLLVLIDQVTKIVTANLFFGGKDMILIKDILRFHYLENHGAAFGIMQGGRWIFLVLTGIFIVLLTYEYFKIPNDKKYHFYRAMTVLIVSGAIGNAIDRVYFGYVRDFIYLELINFPIFNIADCYVTISLFLLIIYSLLPQRKDEEYVYFNGIFEFFEKRDVKNIEREEN